MDKDFHDLLAKYLRGNCSPEEEAKIHEWYRRIEDAELDFDTWELPLMRARMLKNIKRDISGPTRTGYRFLLKVAASVVLLVSFVCLSLTYNRFDADSMRILRHAEADVFENETNDVTLHTLDDGSSVRLYPGAKLEYRNFLENRRQARLTGKAFFDVAHDPSRPFFVYTGTVATRVLGTSFIIDAPFDARKIEVKVITGKVAVYDVSDEPHNGEEARTTDFKSNGVELIPNQKVEYFIEEDEWVVGMVEDPVPIETVDSEDFSFVGARMETLLSRVEDRFGVDVVVENENIFNCTFTGDISRMSLRDVLDVVSNSIGSTYEVKDTRVLLYGAGCN